MAPKDLAELREVEIVSQKEITEESETFAITEPEKWLTFWWQTRLANYLLVIQTELEKKTVVDTTTKGCASGNTVRTSSISRRKQDGLA